MMIMLSQSSCESGSSFSVSCCKMIPFNKLGKHLITENNLPFVQVMRVDPIADNIMSAKVLESIMLRILFKLGLEGLRTLLEDSNRLEMEGNVNRVVFIAGKFEKKSIRRAQRRSIRRAQAIKSDALLSNRRSKRRSAFKRSSVQASKRRSSV
mmetsp:Transcript_13464/g.37214  ORF Transcript_13464/g.37214 Transcript_13464/m.37214 type:complete len:153 (-) Transcript_13464:152-610(-)